MSEIESNRQLIQNVINSITEPVCGTCEGGMHRSRDLNRWFIANGKLMLPANIGLSFEYGVDHETVIDVLASTKVGRPVIIPKYPDCPIKSLVCFAAPDSKVEMLNAKLMSDLINDRRLPLNYKILQISPNNMPFYY